MNKDKIKITEHYTLSMKGTNYSLSREEARELYHQLSMLFEKDKTNPIIPIMPPQYPENDKWPELPQYPQPTPIWCSSQNTFPENTIKNPL